MNPINIEYKSNLEKDVIIKALFQVDEEKFFELSIIDVYDLNDSETIVRQDLRLLFRNLAYGEEEMLVDLSADESKDVNKIMTKMIKQVNSFSQNHGKN